MSLLKYALTYRRDSASLFACIKDKPWAVYLDSGQPMSQYGRYDIMAAEPFLTLSTNGKQTEIRDGSETLLFTDDPFLLLKDTLARFDAPVSELPFCGGAIGYFGYDLARRLEQLPDFAQDEEQSPQMMIGIYDWAVVVDHHEKSAWLVSHGRAAQTCENWSSLCALFDECETGSSSEFRLTSDVVSNMDASIYTATFNKIQHYISAGDCYQVNLAQRFTAKAEGDSWAAYLYLRGISPAPFMVYMNYPDLQVLSGSPERFLQVTGSHVETRPIKGTRPRSDNLQQDKENAEQLINSAKDRAENLMIVDLLRNDIGKNCTVGSVRTKNLFKLESFANVHHLVSTVIGSLAPDKTAIDLLRGSFPGGSVTGAPKLRAMEIIEEMEPHRRGIYCGAIGYIGFDGNMDTNIAIRTAVYSKGEFRFWAGGGLVADSEVQKEYLETWDKASSMLKLMRHFGAQIEGEGHV